MLLRTLTTAKLPAQSDMKTGVLKKEQDAKKGLMIYLMFPNIVMTASNRVFIGARQLHLRRSGKPERSHRKQIVIIKPISVIYIYLISPCMSIYIAMAVCGDYTL